MTILNIEFKATTNRLAEQESNLQTLAPVFIGEDKQTDTYFNVANGRMKLRQGNIENALIHYERENTAANKASDILLYKHKPDEMLKDVLEKAIGIKVVVAKTRKIYMIENVKFHFDEVAGLGTFLEVEAIDTDGSIGRQKLEEQCAYYRNFFNIKNEEMVAVSYSDLLLAKGSNSNQSL